MIKIVPKVRMAGVVVMIRPKKIHSCRKQNKDGLQQEFRELSLEEVNLPVSVVETTPAEIQQIVRGPKERFSGNLTYNLNRLSLRLRGSSFKMEQFLVGSGAPKKVVIAYLHDVAEQEVLKEVKARIGGIQAETILDSSYIERNIEDSGLSPFPQVEITQRPDIAESALFQGRIAVLVENSPDVLLVPATFFDQMDTPDDAYSRWFIASSFFRIARYIMFILAASLPGFYIALTSFNPEMIPTKLAFLIAGSREATPFPVYFEAFLLMGVAEAVRMMMVRLPTQLSSTIALFAGITLIGAGIAARIISIPITMIATLTLISSYGIPNSDLRRSVRLIQFFTMVMATVLGLFGFAMAFIYIFIHLAALKSFGLPYMSPLSPLEGSGWGHTILRENTIKMQRDETYKPVPEK
ncbi:MAG: spore germination protein [Peptococcaceae bacterium]